MRHPANRLAVVIILLAGSILPVTAAVRQSERNLVGLREELTIERLPEKHLGVPTTLATDRDVFLFVWAGCASMYGVTAARPSVDPVRLADALDSAMASATPSHGTVEWSHSDEYSAASVRFSHGRMWAGGDSTTYAIGRLVAGLRRAGYTSHVLLGITRYAHIIGLPVSRSHNARYLWYNGSDLPADLRVTVTGRLPRVSLFTSAALGLMVPLVALVELALIVVIARNQRIGIDRRRRLVTRLPLGMSIAAVAIFVPLYLRYMTSPYPVPIADLWFGTPFADGVLGIAVLPIFVGTCAVLVGFAIQAKLLPCPKEPRVTAEPSGDRRALRRRTRIVAGSALVVSALLLFAVPNLLPVGSPWRQYVRSLAILLGPIASLVSSAMAARYDKSVQRTADTEVTRRAQAIADRMGARVTSVRVDPGTEGSQQVSASAGRDGTITLSAKLLEVMTPEETDYAVARAVAGTAAPSMRILCLMLAIPLASALLVWFLHPGLNSIVYGTSAVIPAGIAMGMIGRSMIRTAEYRTDAKALGVTRNLSAAESFITKSAGYAPGTCEQTSPAEDPHVARRLAALRQAASELNISV